MRMFLCAQTHTRPLTATHTGTHKQTPALQHNLGERHTRMLFPKIFSSTASLRVATTGNGWQWFPVRCEMQQTRTQHTHTLAQSYFLFVLVVCVCVRLHECEWECECMYMYAHVCVGFCASLNIFCYLPPSSPLPIFSNCCGRG